MVVRRTFLARTARVGGFFLAARVGDLIASERPQAQTAPKQAPLPPADSAYSEFQAFLKNARSARGNFRQQVLNQSGRVTETTEGTFAFARPGRFRWEVKKPYEQLIVADGEQFYFFDRDLNQVTVRKLGEALSATPAAILFGNEASESEFTFTEAGRRDGLLWLEAIPRRREAGVERMTLGFGSGMPEALEVVDAFGRTSKFTFGAIERNPALDATLFRFQVPAGADVIRQ
jgi:outer membrane lipoprotein carrier protein